MGIGGALYGYGAVADDREAAFSALAGAVKAIVQLDVESTGHPLRAAWLRAEREMAVIAALRETGFEADPQMLIAARLGACALPRGHAQLGDVDDRARRWAPIAQRKGPAELRALVATLAPVRSDRDLVGLAERVAKSLSSCARAAWELDDHTDGSLPVLRTIAADPGAVDAGDLALALPFALRRIGMTAAVLPGLVGRVRIFGREEVTPLAALTAWASALERQAADGRGRLRELQLFIGQVERQLAGVRRPAALRRLVAVALGNWSVWAAKLARETRVDISSAWRTLEQAADLGLVLPVPGQKRSRGDGTLYAVPPWLRMAGLIAVRRGRPIKTVSGMEALTAGVGLATAMATVDALLADMDRRLAL